jgi:hypothetical protein
MAGLVPAIHAAGLETILDFLGGVWMIETTQQLSIMSGGGAACGRLLRNRLGIAGTIPGSSPGTAMTEKSARFQVRLKPVETCYGA